MNKLLDFGIAVNFFGNYARESRNLNNVSDTMVSSLGRLKTLLIGGGITTAFYKFGNSIMNTAKMMEQNFSTLSATLGSTTKALANLEWARKKGAETPFGIEEVNSATAMMTSMGFNKNDKMREEVFNSIGDFAGLKGFGFADMMQRVAKAGFGNWESLGDQFGIRKQTIGSMVRERVSRDPAKFKDEQADIDKAITMVEKGRSGTEEFRMAIVKLIGVLGRDGMSSRLKTISGALANIDDVFQNFMFNMVGYTQVQGTLANTIKNTIVEQILDPLTKAHVNNYSALKETTTTVDQLGRIGKAVGEMLITVWSGISDSIGGGVNFLVDWIDKLDVFFSDFKNNVAPIVLFIFLVRLEVEDFIKGFMSGFGTAFGFFLKTIWVMLKALGSFASWLGIGRTNSEALGKVLGAVLGTMLGIRALRFVATPFQPLLDGATMLIKKLIGVYNAQKAVLVADGVITSNMGAWSQFRTVITYLSFGLQGATTSAWAFATALLANPITWVVVLVVALVGWLAYLIYNWEEVGRSMQGVSDFALTLTAIFLPLVGVPLLMAKYWGQLKTIFTNVFNGITNYLKAWGIWIQFEIINPVKRLFGEVWDYVKTKAKSFIEYLVTKFPILLVGANAFKTVWDGIKNVFSTVWGFVEKIYDKLANSNFVQSLVSMGERLSSAFSDGGEDAYKNNLKEYDPERYEREFGAKVPKKISPEKSGGGATTSTTETNQKNYNISGNQFVLPKGTTPKSWLDGMKDLNNGK